MIDDGDDGEEHELLRMRLMARLEGIVQAGDVVSYVSVDIVRMQALGLPYTRSRGALVMANEPGSGLHVTYAMELDESAEDVDTELPVLRSEGWPTDDGSTPPPREWKACNP